MPKGFGATIFAWLACQAVAYFASEGW